MTKIVLQIAQKIIMEILNIEHVFNVIPNVHDAKINQINVRVATLHIYFI